MTDEASSDHSIDYEYRKVLVAADQKAQEDFDKTVLSLSGGALGVSFIFLKDVIGTEPIAEPERLFIAWVCWGCSTVAVLISYHLSHRAIRRGIRQIDAHQAFTGAWCGTYAWWTSAMNILGAVLFLVGVFFITYFAHANFIERPTNGKQQAAVKAASPSKADAPVAPSITSGDHSGQGGARLGPSSATAAPDQKEVTPSAPDQVR